MTQTRLWVENRKIKSRPYRMFEAQFIFQGWFRTFAQLNECFRKQSSLVTFGTIFPGQNVLYYKIGKVLYFSVAEYLNTKLDLELVILFGSTTFA